MNRLGLPVKRFSNQRMHLFISDVLQHTPMVKALLLLVVLWLIFAAGIYHAELAAVDSSINSYGRALYWGVAAFSTAGMGDMPVTGLGEFIGAVWIVIGSILFFGAIVATITAYFMKPIQRPSRQIIETIEYNLQQLDDLSLDELALLKETTDSLIEHVERMKLAKLNRD